MNKKHIIVRCDFHPHCGYDARMGATMCSEFR